MARCSSPENYYSGRNTELKLMLIDVPSTPRFLVDVFSFFVHAEFEVGVLALEEFRWKIFLGEDLEPFVVLVCDTIRRMRLVHKPSLRGC